MNFKANKFIFYSILVAFFGFLDATYLTFLHYKNVIPPCTISGCEVVLTSKYATILGVPLALLGSFFYLSVIVVSVLIISNMKPIWLKFYYLLATTGLIVSAILLGLQAFVIHQFCQYCLLSAATSTGIAILAFLNFKKKEQS